MATLHQVQRRSGRSADDWVKVGSDGVLVVMRAFSPTAENLVNRPGDPGAPRVKKSFVSLPDAKKIVV